ncbi:MAG: iron chelate uptake ABC transporter family permease subunit [Candidatus Kapaibacterium sp.]
MLEIIDVILHDYTLRNVALGSSILGTVSGALGTFAFLRKESLMGDVVAHSALLGITGTFLLIYMLTGVGIRSETVLVLGAAASGIIAMLFVSNITKSSRIKTDSAMGIILALFFGGGMFLLTMIQQSDIDNKTGLSSYIFGSAATMSHENVIMMSILGFIALSILIIFRKEIKIHTFDAEFAHTNGFSVKTLDLLILSIIVIAIVIGLQAVGVILMVAMIVAPAAAARQWTNNLWIMVVLSAFFGLLSGFIGAVASSVVDKLPTGPTIVLISTSIFIISVMFSPRRGILSSLIRNIKRKSKIELSLVLENLYVLGLNHDVSTETGHSSKVLRSMNKSNFNTVKSLNLLRRQGFVKELYDDCWVLTEAGISRAERVLREKGQLDD